MPEIVGISRARTACRLVSSTIYILRSLGPHTWGGDAEAVVETGKPEEQSVEEFAQQPFAALPAGVQSIVLLMRALVGRPPLMLLDEVWAGMDDGMIRAARAYLRGGGMGEELAVVVVSHWEDEVPWGVEDGVERFRLEGGESAFRDKFPKNAFAASSLLSTINFQFIPGAREIDKKIRKKQIQLLRGNSDPTGGIVPVPVGSCQVGRFTGFTAH